MGFGSLKKELARDEVRNRGLHPIHGFEAPDGGSEDDEQVDTSSTSVTGMLMFR